MSRRRELPRRPRAAPGRGPPRPARAPRARPEEHRTTALVADALAHVGLDADGAAGRHRPGLRHRAGAADGRPARRSRCAADPRQPRTSSYRSTGRRRRPCLRPRRAHHGGARRRARAAAAWPRRAAAARRAAGVPAGRGGRARRRLDVIDAGALDGLERIYACTATRRSTSAGRAEGRPDHRGERPRRGHAHRSRWPHGAAAPDRRPGHRARRRRHAGARRCWRRRVDPRAGVALVWGQVSGRHCRQRDPAVGHRRVARCARCHHETWDVAAAARRRAVRAVAAPYGVGVEVTHVRGVPPTVNDAACIAALDRAVRRPVADGAIGASTRRASAARTSPGISSTCPARWLGSACGRRAARLPMDLHQSGFDVDERCIAVGVQLLTGCRAVCQVGVSRLTSTCARRA